MIHNMIGGGAALNFKIANNPQPETARENTIWIDTDDITSWNFSATQPETPEDGMVWIFTGATSTAPFNALKKNGITVYPIYAKKYSGGAWVDVDAKTYQNGAWVNWWGGELYTNGDEWEHITGGFATMGRGLESGATATKELTITRGDGSITFKQTASAACGIAYFPNKIDLRGFKTLKCDATMSNTTWSGLCIWTTLDGLCSNGRVARLSSANGGELDVTDLNDSDKYYIGFFAYGGASVKLTSLKLE